MNREIKPMTDSEYWEALNIGVDLTDEADRAREIYPIFSSLHEGYGVLLEEVTELQAEIFKKKPNLKKIKKEAIQVGAMAIRIIQDCC